MITDQKPEEVKGLFNKLLYIQCAVAGLSKDKEGPLKQYKYVTGNKVLDNIKPLMCSLGLILKQETLSITNQRLDYHVGNPPKPKSEMLATLEMRMTWVDCETGEKDINIWGASGMNAWDKGVGSALTYAERYFFLKYFHLETDKDDVDNPARPNNLPENQPVPAPSPEVKPPAPEKKPIGKKAMDSLLIAIANKETQALEDAKKIYTFSDAAVKAITEAIEKVKTSTQAA